MEFKAGQVYYPKDGKVNGDGVPLIPIKLVKKLKKDLTGAPLTLAAWGIAVQAKDGTWVRPMQDVVFEAQIPDYYKVPEVKPTPKSEEQQALEILHDDVRFWDDSDDKQLCLKVLAKMLSEKYGVSVP